MLHDARGRAHQHVHRPLQSLPLLPPVAPCGWVASRPLSRWQPGLAVTGSRRERATTSCCPGPWLCCGQVFPEPTPQPSLKQPPVPSATGVHPGGHSKGRDAPPLTQALRNLAWCESVLQTPRIWSVSSRVGPSTSARGRRGLVTAPPASACLRMCTAGGRVIQRVEVGRGFPWTVSVHKLGAACKALSVDTGVWATAGARARPRPCLQPPPLADLWAAGRRASCQSRCARRGGNRCGGHAAAQARRRSAGRAAGGAPQTLRGSGYPSSAAGSGCWRSQLLVGSPDRQGRVRPGAPFQLRPTRHLDLSGHRDGLLLQRRQQLRAQAQLAKPGGGGGRHSALAGRCSPHCDRGQLVGGTGGAQWGAGGERGRPQAPSRPGQAAGRARAQPRQQGIGQHDALKLRSHGSPFAAASGARWGVVRGGRPACSGQVHSWGCDASSDHYLTASPPLHVAPSLRAGLLCYAPAQTSALKCGFPCQFGNWGVAQACWQWAPAEALSPAPAWNPCSCAQEAEMDELFFSALEQVALHGNHGA